MRSIIILRMNTAACTHSRHLRLLHLQLVVHCVEIPNKRVILGKLKVLLVSSYAPVICVVRMYVTIVAYLLCQRFRHRHLLHHYRNVHKNVDLVHVTHTVIYLVQFLNH